MLWYHYVGHFFGGVFLANAIPHLVAGITGKRMQTPFASPPFRGMSPPPVNIAWALINVALAYLMLVRVAPFDVRSWPDVAAAFAGFGVWSFQCARSFAKLRAAHD